MHRHLGREYLCQSSSLLIVLELLITLDAVVAYHPKHLNTSNTMGALILKAHILTPQKMVPANSQLKTSVSKFLTLSTLPW